jgi:hypothetical protein
MERWSGSTDRHRRALCGPALLSTYRRDYREGAVRRMGSAPLSIVTRDAAVFYGPFGPFTGGAYEATTAGNLAFEATAVDARENECVRVEARATVGDQSEQTTHQLRCDVGCPLRLIGLERRARSVAGRLRMVAAAGLCRRGRLEPEASFKWRRAVA